MDAIETSVEIGNGVLGYKHEVIFTGEVFLSLQNISELEVQKTPSDLNLPSYLVTHETLKIRSWVSDSEGKKLLAAGAKAVR